MHRNSTIINASFADDILYDESIKITDRSTWTIEKQSRYRIRFDSCAVLAHLVTLITVYSLNDSKFVNTAPGILLICMEGIAALFHAVYIFSYAYEYLDASKPNLYKWE